MNHPIPDWANVSRETIERLDIYATLLAKWNSRINLVSRETMDTLWARHIWDCYQLVPQISKEARSLLDIGSGGGLPGLILGASLEISIDLVERDQRKCAFLLEAVRAMRLPHVHVWNCDVEKIRGTYDVITARAVAPLSKLFAMAHRMLGRNGVCLFPKGKSFATEIAEARTSWSFDCREIASHLTKDSQLLLISQLKPLA